MAQTFGGLMNLGYAWTLMDPELVLMTPGSSLQLELLLTSQLLLWAVGSRIL